MKLKVEGHPNLKRDAVTGAIINSNNSAYQNYLIKKAKNNAEKNEIENMKIDINQLKTDISDIKNILLKLIEK